MALIECKLGPTQTSVGGQSYVFAHDRARRAVAQVHDLVHIRCFLSVQHYIEVQPLDDTPLPIPVVLLGAGSFPEVVEFSPERKAALGDIIAQAQTASGFSAEEWNDLPEWDRLERLEKTIDAIQKQVDHDSAGADAQEAAANAEALRMAAIQDEAEAENAQRDAAAAAAAAEAAAAERLAKSKAKVIDPIVDIGGLGPATAAKLAELDITSFAQIAAWDEPTIAMLDEALNLKGAIKRGDWVGQAKVFQELKEEAEAEEAAKAAKQRQG